MNGISNKILWITCLLVVLLLCEVWTVNGAPKKGAKAKPAVKGKAVAKKVVAKIPTEYKERTKILACQFLHAEYLVVRRIVQLGDAYGEGRVSEHVFRDVFEKKSDLFSLLEKDSDSLFCHLDRNGDKRISQADVVHSRLCHGEEWPYFQFELFDNNLNDAKLGPYFIQTGVLYLNVVKKYFISKKKCAKGKAHIVTFDDVYDAVSTHCKNSASPGCAPIGKPYPTSQAKHAKFWRALFETERHASVPIH